MQPVRIESAADPALREAAALASQLKRAATGRFLVEGTKLTEQAAAAGLLRAVFLVDDAEPGADLPLADSPCYRLPRRLLPKLIGTHYETAVEMVGIAERRLLATLPERGLVLACESIQDPRNVGVLIRTAEATGCAAIVFSDDSADPFGRAAVRSSTGSILRQPLHLTADLPALLEGRRVIATSARADSQVWQADLTGDLVLLLGTETSGLTDAARDVAEGLVGLPMHGGASSLNVTVAAGAMLYEALRQRRGNG